MEGKKLEQVTDEKDLGISIDDDLKFHEQTTAATKKANGVLGLLKKSFIPLNKITLSLLHKFFFIIIFIYAFFIQGR